MYCPLLNLWNVIVQTELNGIIFTIPLTRSSSGVIVAHLIPTLWYFMASAASTVTLSSVLSRFGSPRSKYLMSKSRYGSINYKVINKMKCAICQQFFIVVTITLIVSSHTFVTDIQFEQKNEHLHVHHSNINNCCNMSCIYLITLWLMCLSLCFTPHLVSKIKAVIFFTDSQNNFIQFYFV